MNGQIILPRLLGFRLSGFQPIFNEDVEMNLDGGPYVILGGNSLGKTTLVQAVIFGLTGGNESFEEEKSLRWNHKFFTKRLSNHKAATVEIVFGFDKTIMSVRRGFQGSKILGFRLGKEQKDWIENFQEAKKAFEGAVSQFGGYKTIQDFCFLVHRLIYLSEDRKLLAWDANAQIRTLMILNPDITIEERFHRRRGELKKLDSKTRHLHVILTKLEEEITKKEKLSESIIEGGEKELKEAKEERNDLEKLVKELGDFTAFRHEVEKKKEKISIQLNEIAMEVEELREKTARVEASLLFTSLAEEEKSGSLALYKMADIGICPSCGTHQASLKAQAIKFLRNHQCLICGSDKPCASEPELSTLLSILHEKTRAHKVLENAFRLTSNKLEQISRKEEQLQFKVYEIHLSDPTLALLERKEPITLSEDPSKRKAELEKIYKKLQADLLKRKSALEKEFSEFRSSINFRITKLRKMYEVYATEFLGIECVLTEATVGDLISFKSFVPIFNKIIRYYPESCSEAQRFFLDIAFRMALLDFAGGSGNYKTTFICETPETALDLSYIDNVVRMFKRFLENKHDILFTANIQTDSMAGKILKFVSKDKRRSHIVNLLEIGNPTEVHKRAMKKLKQTIKNIVD